MKDLIQKGTDKQFSFNDDHTRIFYKTNQKNGNANQLWNETEEKVRAETVVKLVQEKHYPIETIGIEVPVSRGVDNKRADIIIYKVNKNKKKTNQAYIVIETKTEKDRNLKGAKDQALSYAKFTGAEYAVATNGKDSITIHIGKDEDRTVASIPDFGGDAPKWKYLRNSKTNDISPMDKNRLKGLLKEIHDYLWNGGKRNPAEAFNEFSKIVFTKIMDEKVTKRDKKNYTPYYQFQKDRDETNEQLELRIKALYDSHKEKDSNVFDDKLILDEDEIAFLVKKLERYNLNKTDLDIKGKIFQDFFADFFKGDAGQYFTPMNIVRFIVNLFDLQEDDKVIDPSCGSGGFLLQSLAQMQNKAKTDLESIEEPTPDEYIEAHDYWHSFAENNLFGIEISGGISRTAKMNMIIHDDGHTNVITHDGLDSFVNFKKKNTKFKENSFDYVFTNPPFGSNIKDDKPYFSTFSEFSNSSVDFIDALIDNKKSKDLKNQKSEILFLERYYQLLKPSTGIVAMVLPDGILTNSSMQHVRDYLIEKFKMVASFSLPQHTFSNYGAGVKSSILVLQKKSAKEEKAFIDTQDKIQLKFVTKYKPEILAIRKELKDILAKGCAKQQRLSERYDRYKKTIDKKKVAKLTAIYRKWFKILQDKEWITEKKEEYKLKEEIVKDKIYDAVNNEMKKIKKYPIFMAIIEEIGEDAKGKITCKYEDTELATVSQEFQNFYEEVYIKNNVNFT